MSCYADRSTATELIDLPGIPFPDWAQCLRELNMVNTLLGGHRITIAGVKRLLHDVNRPVTIAEIGCGGGDNLLAIHRWNQQAGLPLRYVGIDMNEACVTYARENCRSIPGARFICSDYRMVRFDDGEPDIIFSSLFCHHFSNEALIEMLHWLRQHAALGFFINDLQRHPIAFHSIGMLTRLFSRSYLVRHDAPISVLRGFKRAEWKQLLIHGGITNYSIDWMWAFRYLLIVRNEFSNPAHA